MEITEEMLEQYCVTEEKPQMLIQFTKTFIRHAKEGKSKLFTYSESQKTPVLKHDRDTIHVYRNAPKTSILDLPDGESYDRSVANMNELITLKQNFLNKPFIVRTPISAERKSYKNKNVKVDKFKTDVMVVFYPEHEVIHKQLAEAFKFAEEKTEKGEKFSLQLNLTPTIWVWFTELLQKATDDEFEISCFPYAVFEMSTKSKGIKGFLKSSEHQYFAVRGTAGFTKDVIL